MASPSWRVINYTVNLVPFGEGFMELRIRENRNFVVPVNVLTLFVHAHFLGQHYTLLSVLICLNWNHSNKTHISFLDF